MMTRPYEPPPLQQVPRLQQP